MNSRFWTSACLGGVLAGVVWAFLPGHRVREDQDLMELRSERLARPGKEAGRGVYRDLGRANSAEKKLAALERLQGLNMKGLEREMEECPEKEYQGKLSFAVKAMILRLAEIDPLTALEFIRERWVDDDEDDDYVAERFYSWPLVSAEWAHQDPVGMLAYWEETQKTQNHPLRIYQGDLADLLLAGSLSGWMTLYHTTDFSPIRPESFLSKLKTERDFREALDTWNHPPAKARERWDLKLAKATNDWEKERVEEQFIPKMNILAQKIIQRWKKVDEAGFLKSEFVEWEKGE